MPEPTPLIPPMYLSTLTTDLTEQNGKAQIPGDPDPDPSLSDSSFKNLMTAIPVNKLKTKAIKRKIIRNTRNRTRQTHQ